MKQPFCRRKGFTLIELLVAIAILGVLASLIVAAARKSRSKGHIAGCASHLRQIGIALHLYADDRNGIYPPADDDLTELYPTYIDDLAVFTCPATGHKLTDPENIKTPQPGEDWIGMDYEYRGSEIPGEEERKAPSQQVGDRIPTHYLLAWDSDNRGTNRIIDEEDNHEALGGNKLFSDGSVRWFKASEWGFGD